MADPDCVDHRPDGCDRARLLVGGALVLLGIGLANRLERPEQEANAALCEATELVDRETVG